MIRHLVFLRFSNDIPRQDRDALMGELAALQDEIDGIETFCARPNRSPETAFTRGLSEMFWFDFRDSRARDAYLANETHKAIGARLLASLDGGADGIFVCDIEL
ncbi:MAG: Dabb family protein [Pseudomonadota bacterium]